MNTFKFSAIIVRNGNIYKYLCIPTRKQNSNSCLKTTRHLRYELECNFIFRRIWMFKFTIFV